MQSFFSEGVNWLMQLQFLERVELFLKPLNGCSFDPTILEGQRLGTAHIIEKCCVSFYLFSFSVCPCVVCDGVVVVVCVCVSVFLVVFGASAMKVNAWTCAPATASDLESALRSISVRTRTMVNYA